MTGAAETQKGGRLRPSAFILGKVMRAIYRIAGRVIAVQSIYENVHELCRAYRAEGEPDFTVAVTPEDVAFERKKSAREDELAGLPERPFSDGYLETLAVYRKIAEKMPDYDTVLLHGSCVAVDGEAFLFTAKSGTGKSTHARLWRELFGERAVMVNDDKPLLRMTDGGVLVCGTPWDGKHRLSSNIAVPLKGLCILERAAQNRIVPVTAPEAYPVLLQQTYRPADAAAMRKTLALLDRLSASVAFWRLGCNMDIEAARVAYDAMKG